jgi:PAS domain S-box-containing protein
MNPTPTPTLRAGASADSGAGGHTTDDHRVNTVRTWWGLLDEWIPTGRRLSDARWPQRHQAVVWVLWLHLPVLGAVGLLTGDDPVHVVGGVGLLAAGAVIAGSRRLSRRFRTLAAVAALVSCSAVLVHFTGGLTESHFHFFAVVAFIMLYQEWLPFLVTLGYVVVHHGILGVLYPLEVFNHEAAWSRPWLWALVHGGFVLLASLASMATWRLAEIEREHVEQVLTAAGDAIYGVDQQGRITFVNQKTCELVGQDRSSIEGADAHRALDHRSASGAPVQPSDCPVCTATVEGLVEPGEAHLGGVGAPDAVPVEYVVRPVRGRSAAGTGSVVTIRDLRERRALDARRAHAEGQRDQLASIVEASPDMALVGRSDGTFVWMNRAGRRLLGIDESEDISAYRIEDMFSAEEMARVYAEDMPILARDGDWQGEWTLQAHDGTQIPTWVTHHVHYDANEQPIYVTGIMRDLRPQRAAEGARRENERRLAAAEGVTGTGSWEWDPETDAVMWSPGMYALHGMEQGDGEESFEAWLATVHPDDRARAQASAEQGRSEGSLDFTYRAVRSDGRLIVIHCRGERIGKADGTGKSLMGTLLDITERHAVAEALQDSEERARSVLATAHVAYIQLDRDGFIREWNRQAEISLGWSRGEVMGRTLSDLAPSPGEPHAFERRIALHSDHPADPDHQERFEATVRHRSGREFPAEVTAWTVGTARGPVLNYSIRDISERHAAERAKNEFVSVVGHELRTPLAAIHGALGLLRAGLLGDLTERGQHMVDIAAHNTDRLVRLINDVLDIERLSSGKVPLQLQGTDLAELARRSVESMRPMADDAGVRLEAAAESTHVWVDPDRIEQTLTNLLSNAIKFSSAGGLVQLQVRRYADDIRVEVRDDGRGIPPDQLERIFDRFEQVDASDSREKGGTGLGLAISRTIIDQHGGRIWADSAPGSGATFTFSLPADGRPAVTDDTGLGVDVGRRSEITNAADPCLTDAGRPPTPPQESNDV